VIGRSSTPQEHSPTPVRRRFNLTLEGLGRVIPGGEKLAEEIKISSSLLLEYGLNFLKYK